MPREDTIYPDDERLMPLLGHLGELRTRLIRSALAITAGTAVGFWVATPIKRTFVELLPSDQVQALGPSDAFGITFRIALMVGIVLAMPVLLYQLWAFIAPGLTSAEKREVRPWLPAALVCFALGLGLAWLVLPHALTFLLAFTDEYIRGDELAAVPYFDFVITMFLVFGFMMEFPILLIGLSMTGILTAARLRSSRRYVAVGIAIVAAMVTPGGDVTAPLILGGTMYVLFEITLLFIRRQERRRKATQRGVASR